MAIEWYLLSGKNSLLNGLDDSENGFITDDFNNVLESSIAHDVELYNYDLSKRMQIKAIIQNTVQDTKLKTLTRLMLAPIGSCKAGMYVKYKNRFWLIVSIVDDNGMYEKAVLSICNYLLTWLNDNGSVIQRWANVSSASQYNNGETSTEFYRSRTDQLIILTPDDDECVLLDSGKRFIIDHRCKIYERNFGNVTEKNTDYAVSVYKLTRTDSVLYDYQDSGNHEFMVYQDEQKESDGYYVIDGHGYWLCQEPVKHDVSTTLLPCSILCESDDIYNGLDAVIFDACFKDNDGNIVDVIPSWEIKCDFYDQLEIQYDGSSILISVDNPKLINKSFELLLSGPGYEKVTKKINIKAFL